MHSIPHIILIYANIKADYWLGMNILFKKDDQMTNMLGDIHEKLRELAVGVSKKKQDIRDKIPEEDINQ